jgi:hypothetical protein
MFNKWLKLTNQYTSKHNDEKHSHLLLNGGKLYVQPENQLLFNKKYAKAITYNENLYVVECKKEYFKLFFDLDFLLDIDNIDINIFNEVIKVINENIKYCYGSYYKCIITSADYKKITSVIKSIEEPGKVIEKKQFKKGFHLHFPELTVNIEIAMKIRKICIINLKTIYGKIEHIINNFSDIIDESVFKGSGLRLTGSKKGQFISQTNEWLEEGRPNELHNVLIENEFDNEEFTKLNNDYEYLVNETSIITYKTDMNELKTLNCEECELSPDEEYPQKNEGTWNSLDKNSNNYREILRFFANYVKDYSGKDIKRIYISDNEKTYLLNSRSKYCQNIQRNHKSEHIYFILNSEGIYQRCFCRCNTQEDRRYGYCKDYSSNPIPCTPHLLKLLNFNIDKNKVILKVDSTGTDEMLLDSIRDAFYNKFTNKCDLKTKKR